MPTALLWALLACLFFIPGKILADATLTASLDSRYVSEGQDNQVPGGIVTATLDLAEGPLFAQAWLAQGTRYVYQEANLVLGLEQELGGGVLIGGGARAIFADHDDFGSMEDYEALAYVGLTRGRFSTRLESYHSHRADGTYTFLRQGMNLSLGTASFFPYIELGYDRGYVVSQGKGMTTW